MKFNQIKLLTSNCKNIVGKCHVHIKGVDWCIFNTSQGLRKLKSGSTMLRKEDFKREVGSVTTWCGSVWPESVETVDRFIVKVGEDIVFSSFDYKDAEVFFDNIADEIDVCMSKQVFI